MFGCSSSFDPIQPQDTTSGINPSLDIPIETNNSNRNLLGTWTVNFDNKTLSTNITPYREITAHLNVSASIPTPIINGVAYNPLTGIWDVDVTIVNSSIYNVRDLRLILYTNDYGVKLINADDWTGLWDMPGGSQINPFKAYAKTEGNRLFAAQTQHTERIQIYLPPGASDVAWAVDVSVPDNCHEPYLIESFTHFRLNENAGSQTQALIEVFDWQDDVSDVSLYCPIITGETLVQFTHDSFNTWTLELYNNTGAMPGSYTGVVIATSNGNSLYDFVTITVSEKITAELTIFFYLWDADLTDWVSVNVNEMEVVGSVPDELNLVVLREENYGTDQYILEIVRDPDGYNGEIISPRINDHFEVIPPGGAPMGNPQTLVNYLNWGIREYPARHYGLILFGHGNGPFSINPDEAPWLSFIHGMQVWTLRDACLEVLQDHPEIDKLDFIHFESCLMGWYETAFGLSDVTKIGVASEMVMSGYTAEYSRFIQFIVDNLESYNPYDASACYVQTYLDTAASEACPTLAAWDTDINKNEVIPSLEIFSQELIDALPAHRAEIQFARQEAGHWGQNCNNRECTDLGYFAECVINLTASLPSSLINAATELRDDIEAAVYFHGHYPGTGTGCWYDESGWQIWFPEDYDNPDYDGRRNNYQSLGIDALLWDDFLDAYDD